MRIEYQGKLYELIEFVEPDTQKKHDIIGVFEVSGLPEDPEKYTFIDYFYFGGQYDKSYLEEQALDILREHTELSLDDYVECSWCGDVFPSSDCRHESRLGWLCPQCEQAIRSRGEFLSFDEGGDL